MGKTGIIITLLLCMSFEDDFLIQGQRYVLECVAFEILMHQLSAGKHSLLCFYTSIQPRTHNTVGVP